MDSRALYLRLLQHVRPYWRQFGAGILFMVEIGVGTITASILTDEPFGWQEILGVLMITTAALVEPSAPIPQDKPFQIRYKLTGSGPQGLFEEQQTLPPVQTLLQPPQLRASVSKLTHSPAQSNKCSGSQVHCPSRQS